MTRTPRARPLLIFDGECEFCRYWVNYWRALTGTAVEYAAYQTVGREFPEIPPAAFARSIYLIDPDGSVCKGAEASFRTLAWAPGWHPGLWLYQHVPGVASLSEALYAFIARHRVAFAHISRFFFGANLQPARFVLLSTVLVKGLALIYLLAFLSFWVQARGLIGSQGILPVQDLLGAAGLDHSPSRFLTLPTLFWLDSSDAFIALVCAMGSTAALAALFSGRSGSLFALLFLSYLSLVSAGQVFMTFQWDYLLLEAGFLGIFLRAAPVPYIWLFRWLVFRFMWEAGMVKWTGDLSWQSLSALDYHFFTQPLPTPLAWYAQQIPEPVRQLLTAVVLVIELIVPFFVFMPRRIRAIAAWAFVALQIAILVTGNYGFFNLLMLLLCLSLFDDASLAGLATRCRLRFREVGTQAASGSGWLIAFLLFTLSGAQLAQRWLGVNPIASVSRLIAPLHIANSYGPFAVMTKERRELEVQASVDGHDWQSCQFRYKPGAVDQAPRWIFPHQPRLDWQFWFAALDEERPLWLWHFLRRLQQGSAPVQELLAAVPFPGQAPRYVRIRVYDYRFTDGGRDWWQRSPVASAN